METDNTTGGKRSKKIKDETPKKRGRKPKEKTYSVMKLQDSREDDDDTGIILHLLVRTVDLGDTINTILEYKPQISEPQPYEPENNFDFLPVDEEQGEQQSTQQSQQQQGEEQAETAETNTEEICEQHQQILPAESAVPDIENGFSNGSMILIQKNLLNIMFEFIDSKCDEWPKSTSIHCMWDCHAFEGAPCAIPMKYINGKFYVFGCFCSFNCAMAYVFEQKTSNKWEQYSLLLLLYKKLYGTEYVNLKIAPPRQSLKMFGGIFGIDQFRNHFASNRDYSIVYPPMIAIIPKLEENIYESSKLKYIPINSGLMKEATLKLKREKPLHTEITLESYMNFKA